MYIHVYLCTLYVHTCVSMYVHACVRVHESVGSQVYVCVRVCIKALPRVCGNHDTCMHSSCVHVCVMQVQQHVCIYALLSCDLSFRTTGSCEVRSRAIPAANVSSEPSRGSSALPVPSRFHFSHTFRERWRLMRTSPYRYLPRLCLTLSSPSAMTAASRALAEHDTSTFLEVGRGWEWGGGVEGGR